MGLTNDIVECVAHTHTVEDDCDYCKAELTALQSKYTDMVRENIGHEQRLAAQGIGVDQSQFFQLRQQMILAAIFGENLKARHRFELHYVEQCAKLLDQAEGEGNKQKLLRGVNGVKVPRN